MTERTADRPVMSIQSTALPCSVFSSSEALSRHVAEIVATIIRERQAQKATAVLGLPTGSTPMGVYRELVRMHQEEGLDLSNVITFNLDEYYGLKPTQLQSYHRQMHEVFFQHVNIASENIHIPDGMIPLDEVDAYCDDYEAKIREAGGIDLMLLGIGSNGHIGFNEPFSIHNSRTRLCTLDPITRRGAASDFFHEENVPHQAITMGLGTILEARKILLLALGQGKSSVIRELLEGPVTNRVPATCLQDHRDTSVFIDSAAGIKLTAVDTPWVEHEVEWDQVMIKRAVLWLCEQAGKSLLKLDDDDFRKFNLHQLLRHHGPAPSLAHRVFRWMMDTIEYHPAGKEKKKAICFSPHPDDDVISMGGTLIRLIDDGHEAHVAYMTSGNIAVFDHDAQRFADFVTQYNRLFGIDEHKSAEVEGQVVESLKGKPPGEPDIEAVLTIKGLIRRSEAIAGALKAGCQEEHLHFLDLPFYRTGKVAKNPLGPEDVQIVKELILKVQPDQVYIAGDLSDPHGTHRVCAMAIFNALLEIEAETGSRPEALLYRGAWQEYPLHEIEICVPLSPNDMFKKRQAIFMHESQKDSALFPGTDPREFWERAEDRNIGTADSYNRIGLPEYFAMEAFVRWNGQPL
ncbi:glucosamine-6-phosphate deaminase [Bremerella cremea]|uniref:Glucosamine-6-phosphate deaminase n=1 Tax=Blastopirellula marina TaxID=124 RepID=A0A2S8FVE9_9BACT|nr:MULTISPECIES: glucosamine-6-phosphate deaminase [Pirellulaceae]PQO36155.1 glucosamine-6-phosphate deaminase [Blastopirellula marina]RCS48832.1 glucosamine-6-phosphate deaminase [Bremerella cremea]